MPAPYIIDVPFTLGGLDLSIDGMLVGPSKCTAIKNIRKLESEAVTEREGFKAVSNAATGASYGTFCYEKTHPTTFEVTKQWLKCASKLYKKVDYDFTISYAGAGQAVVEVLVDPTTETWNLRLYVDGAIVLDFDLGIGFDEVSPVTISDLDTAITAVADFSATVTSGGSSLPAAFLDSTPPTLIEGGSLVINISNLVATNSPTGATDLFAGTHAARLSEAFENISKVETEGNIYFLTKYDEQTKFDGVDHYRAGMPEGVLPVLAGAGAGTLVAGTYKYIITYVQIDANGLEVEGDESTSATIVSGITQNINVQVTNILNTTGFNTDCAIVAGAQVTVNTITVDDGSGGAHTMKVGQTAYFFDSVTGGYVTRSITATAASTITVSGAAVTVADNAVISNNLRIRIRRTVTTGSIFKQNVDIPNNSFAANQTYNDGKADSSLGADFDSPSALGENHGLPPRAAYGAIFNRRPVVGGISGDPLGIAWAAASGPEYYPDDYRDFIDDSNTSVTGMGVDDRFLWIHTEKGSHLLTGNLFTATFNISRKGGAIGCVSHASIKETDVGLVWAAASGVYLTKDGSIPVRVGDEIAPVFTNKGLTEERKLRFKRSVAVWDKKNKLYLLHAPAEAEQGGEVYTNSRSRLFALDLFSRPNGQGILYRGEWYEWDTLDFSGGADYDETTEELYFSERAYSFFDGATTHKLYRRLNTNTIYDQVDHTSAISWRIKPGWWHGEMPTVNKGFIHLAMFATDQNVIPSCTFTVKTEKNFVEGVVSTKLTQTFGTPGGTGGFGYEAFGFFPFGNPQNTTVRPRRLKQGETATAYRAVFEGGEIYTKFLLSSYQFQVSSPFKIDMKEVKNI